MNIKAKKIMGETDNITYNTISKITFKIDTPEAWENLLQKLTGCTYMNTSEGRVRL
jgi:hypothetical protein